MSLAAFSEEKTVLKSTIVAQSGTTATFPVTLGKCDMAMDDRTQRAIAKSIKEGQKSYLLVLMGNQLAAQSMDSDVSGSANDTFQVRCYRCGMGQNIGVNKDFCKQQYGLWDASKSETKAKCK